MNSSSTRRAQYPYHLTLLSSYYRLVLLDFASDKTYQICLRSYSGAVPGNKDTCGIHSPRALAIMDGVVYFSTGDYGDQTTIMKFTGNISRQKSEFLSFSGHMLKHTRMHIDGRMTKAKKCYVLWVLSVYVKSGSGHSFDWQKIQDPIAIRRAVCVWPL